jgi:sarcosine oxidase delta subunit
MIVEKTVKRIEMIAKSTSAKNGQRRVITNRDNIRHLKYFMNGQWRHSAGCKEFTNKDCTLINL